jgi:hypothetical protein
MPLKVIEALVKLVTTSFLIPLNFIEFWKDRLKNNDICFEGPTKRFDNDNDDKDDGDNQDEKEKE